MEKIKIIINENIFIKDFIYKNYSKKFYGFLKSNNSLFLINNNIVDINSHLSINDEFVIMYNNKIKNTIMINKEVDIIYEDDYFLVVDKPYNLLTIPSKNEIDSLYSRLLYHKSEYSLNIITRLDKLTRGLVVVAKKHYLANDLNENILLKEYTAKTDNLLPQESGIIDLPILKSDSIKRIIDEEGKKSITHYKLIDKDNKIYSLVLKTGRTHQIRVHLSSCSAPIYGDELYGSINKSDLCLICSNIEIKHPITNKIIKLSSNYKLR